MGFFTSTEDTYNDIYIENAHRYEDEYGINLITLEAVQFGQEVFGDMVRSDIRECTTGVIQESVVQDIWEKVKAFFKKVWNKIKLFFKGLYAKILARMTSDNKAFYNKYHKDVDDNTDALSMEVKYRTVGEMPDISKVNIKYDRLKNLSHHDNLKSNEDLRQDIFTKILSMTTNIQTRGSIANFSDFKNELKENVIGDEEDVKFSSIKKDIEGYLKDGNKNIKDAQDAEKKCLTAIKNAEGKFKRKSDADAKAADVDANKSGTLRSASTLVSIVTTYSSAIVDIIKFRNSQARKIYARAVSYKESYDYDYELAFTEADSLV